MGAKNQMNSISQISIKKSIWVVLALPAVLVSCATGPYYEEPPITPTNVSPGDDVNISVNAETTFTWLPTENTEYYEFHIYNQQTKDTTQYRHDNLQDGQVCLEGQCSLTLNVDLPMSKGHAWRVRAGNNAGLSEWNRTRFNMISANAVSSTSTESSTEQSVDAGTEVDLAEVTQSSAEPGENQAASAGDAVVENTDDIPNVELAAAAVEVAEPDADKANDGTQASDNEAVRSDAKEEPSSEPASVLDGPALMQPAQGRAVATGSLVDFKWRSIPDAVSYDFYIYDSVAKEMIESLTDIAADSLCKSDNECGLTREVALPEANHSWRVRANFEDGASPFSSNQFAVTP